MFIATEDTGQQLRCLLSPRTAQREFYICPDWKQPKSFTSNCFATERRAFSCGELFMKWFCFPQNISIFHWKPEQAIQETAWNTSVLKSHHSTPEILFCFFVGGFACPPKSISQIHWPGSSADAYLPTYARKEYCQLWKMQWSQGVITVCLFVGTWYLPPNSVIVSIG